MLVPWRKDTVFNYVTLAAAMGTQELRFHPNTRLIVGAVHLEIGCPLSEDVRQRSAIDLCDRQALAYCRGVLGHSTDARFKTLLQFVDIEGGS